jgi:PilZ domain-containing protein
MTNANTPGPMSGNSAVPSPERRRSGRRAPGVNEPLRCVRSRTGHDLDVIDLSDSGLLVEGRARLLPNTHLDIHIVTRAGRVLVRCRVVRAVVWHLASDLVRYRVGLAFDRRIETAPGYPLHGEIPGERGEAGTRYPDSSAPAATGTDIP